VKGGIKVKIRHVKSLEVYFVYGTRTYIEEGNFFDSRINEFFIHDKGEWKWVDSENYEPVE
jgi:hypothetical protein